MIKSDPIFRKDVENWINSCNHQPCRNNEVTCDICGMCNNKHCKCTPEMEIRYYEGLEDMEGIPHL